jgi:anti-sigma regulatory factor (Ser/Thr protein kinase)
MMAIRIRDQGGGGPVQRPQTPDLAAKLAGQQSPRGWGLFLIAHLVDDMRVTDDAPYHTVELRMSLDGARHAGGAG